MINEDLNRTVESEIVTEKEDRKKKESKRQLDNYYYLKSLGVCTRCGRRVSRTCTLPILHGKKSKRGQGVLPAVKRRR